MSSSRPIEDRLADDAAAALPPVRDDEPASLRGDILDELRDHLACAYRRELLRTNGDPSRAEANVRQRFGDPAWIARRLWFDAMKGRIMAQRFLIGTTGLLALAVCLLAFFAWQLVESNRRATAAMLAQGQQTQAALLERLAAIDEKPRWSGTPEWNPFVLKFVTDAPGSPPASDVTVLIEGPQELFNSGGYVRYAAQFPGKDGVIDHTPARVGTYVVDVTMPSGETTRRLLYMQPGHPLEETIVVPSEPLPTTSATFDIEWPKSLVRPDGKAPLVVLSFSQTSLRKVDGQEWGFNTPQIIGFGIDGRIDLLAKYRQSRSEDEQQSSANVATEKGMIKAPTKVYSIRQQPWGSLENTAAPTTGLDQIVAFPLKLSWVTLWQGEELPKDPNALFKEGVSCEWSVPIEEGGSPLMVSGAGQFGNGHLSDAMPNVLSIARPAPKFELIPDKPNHWTISIPEGLAEQFLAVEKQREEKSQKTGADGEA